MVFQPGPSPPPSRASVTLRGVTGGSIQSLLAVHHSSCPPQQLSRACTSVYMPSLSGFVSPCWNAIRCRGCETAGEPTSCDPAESAGSAGWRLVAQQNKRQKAESSHPDPAATSDLVALNGPIRCLRTCRSHCRWVIF